MMVNEEITIIAVSVVCVLIVIAAIVAVSVYFCCGYKNRRKPSRYQVPPVETTNSQASANHQDETVLKPLPKVGSSGLWMTKPIMRAQGPNDAYHQLKPNGMRKEPYMIREILSTPNINQPSGYIYQGNLRMYHSQQLPHLVSTYTEHPAAYYNEGFIYPAYVDAGLSHRSSMRFLEASGYYAPEHLTREALARDIARHQNHRDSGMFSEYRSNGDLRQNVPKPQRSRDKSPQIEKRKSRSVEPEASSGKTSKSKSNSSSSASQAESVIERTLIPEPMPSSSTSHVPVTNKTESIQSKVDEQSSSHELNKDLRLKADGETKAEIAIPPSSSQLEPVVLSLDNTHESQSGQSDIPADQQSYIESVSDATDMESKGQKITTQAFEFLDTYISDVDDEVDRPKYLAAKS